MEMSQEYENKLGTPARETALVLLQEKDNRIARIKDEFRVEKEKSKALNHYLQNCEAAGQKLADMLRDTKLHRGETISSPRRLDEIINDAILEINRVNHQASFYKQELDEKILQCQTLPVTYKISGTVSTVTEVRDEGDSNQRRVASNMTPVLHILEKIMGQMKKNISLKDTIFEKLSEKRKVGRKLLRKRIIQLRGQRDECVRVLQTVIAFLDGDTFDEILLEEQEDIESDSALNSEETSATSADRGQNCGNLDEISFRHHQAIVSELRQLCREHQKETQNLYAHHRILEIGKLIDLQVRNLIGWERFVIDSVEYHGNQQTDSDNTRRIMQSRDKPHKDEASGDEDVDNDMEIEHLDNIPKLNSASITSEKKRLQDLLDYLHCKLLVLKEKLEHTSLCPDSSSTFTETNRRTSAQHYTPEIESILKEAKDLFNSTFLFETFPYDDQKIPKHASMSYSDPSHNRTGQEIILDIHMEEEKQVIDVSQGSRDYRITNKKLSKGQLNAGMPKTETDRVEDLEIALHKTQIELRRYKYILNSKEEELQEKEQKINEMTNSLQTASDTNETEDKSMINQLKQKLEESEQKNVHCTNLLTEKDKTILEYERLIEELREGDNFKAIIDKTVSSKQPRDQVDERLNEPSHCKLYYWDKENCITHDLKNLSSHMTKKEEEIQDLYNKVRLLGHRLRDKGGDNKTHQGNISEASKEEDMQRGKHVLLERVSAGEDFSLARASRENTELIQEPNENKSEVVEMKILLNMSNSKVSDLNALLDKMRERETLNSRDLANEKILRKQMENEKNCIKDKVSELRSDLLTAQRQIADQQLVITDLDKKQASFSRENEMLKSNLSSYQAKCKDLEDMMNSLKEDKEDLELWHKIQDTKINEEMIKLKEDLEESQKEMGDLYTNWQTALRDKNGLTDIVNDYKEKVENLIANEQNLENVIEDRSKEILKLSTENSNLSRALQEAYRELDEKEIIYQEREKSYMEALEVKDNAISDWKARCGETEEVRNTIQEELEVSRNKIMSLEENLYSASDKVLQLERLVSDLQDKETIEVNRASNLEDVLLSRDNEMEEVIQENEALNNEVERLSLLLMTKRDVVDSLTKSLKQSETEVLLLNEKMEAVQNVMEENRALLLQSKSQKDDRAAKSRNEVVDQLMATISQRETQIEHQTREISTLKNIIVQMKSNVSTEISYLKKNLDELKHLADMDYFQAMTTQILHYLTQVKGENYVSHESPDPLPSVSTHDVREDAFDETNRQIETNGQENPMNKAVKEEDIHSLQGAVSSKEQHFEDISKELGRLKTEKELEEHQMHRLVESLQETLDSLRDELMVLKHEKEAMNHTVESTNDRIDQLQEDNAEYEKMIGLLKNQSNGKRSDMDDLSTIVEELREHCNELQRAIHGLEEKKASDKMELNSHARPAYQGEITQRVIEQSNYYETEIRHLKSKLYSLEEKLEMTKESESKLRQEVSEMRLKVILSENNANSFHSQLMAVNQELQTAKSEYKEQLRELEKVCRDKDKVINNLNDSIVELKQILENQSNFWRTKERELERQNTDLQNEVKHISELEKGCRLELNDLHTRFKEYKVKQEIDKSTIEQNVSTSKEEYILMIKKELSETMKDKYAFMSKAQEFSSSLDDAQDKIKTLRGNLSRHEEELKCSRREHLLAQTELEWLQWALKEAKVDNLPPYENHRKPLVT